MYVVRMSDEKSSPSKECLIRCFVMSLFQSFPLKSYLKCRTTDRIFNRLVQLLAYADDFDIMDAHDFLYRKHSWFKIAA